MYESFFGLARRPFSATPDPGCWFRCGHYQAALDELLICAEQGQGIGLLVAPPGVGKTLICERLIREIGEPFTSVLLRHATYNTRRGFLQTLLCELAQPFDKHTDQELRLGLAPVLRNLHQQGRALLVVVDEAHQLSESLLEELRILSDQAEDGQPIVRLILAGQFGLEEKLAHPALQALNQRVRAHVTLAPLTQAESADYLDFRITWGGGRTAELFTDEAVDLICRAADGVPRCLNQLCDHTLLMAYVNEQKPISVETVAAALEDLKHLPLPWNLPVSRSESLPFPSATVIGDDAHEDLGEVAWEPNPTADDNRRSVAEAEPSVEDPQAGDDAWPELTLSDEQPAADELTRGAISGASEPTTPPRFSPETFHEEPVLDRYTALDAGLEPPAAPTGAQTISAQFPGLPFTVTATLWGPDATVTERLDAIQDTLSAVQAVDRGVELLDLPQAPAPAPIPVVESVPDNGLESAESNRVEDQPAAAVFEFGDDAPFDSNDPNTGAVSVAAPATRSCRNLFTMLRRKQLGRCG
uniref:AAA family ATPase n=1 Tax=Schlesneria paludicola TaxID=360056 RepID=A0A7C2P579_9PLAN